MDLLEFDNLFGTVNEAKQLSQMRKKEKGDQRLDFFSHLLKRLYHRKGDEGTLRFSPTIYANHVEYIQTFLPMIIEDAVAAIPTNYSGGHLIDCVNVTRWAFPFYVACCSCEKNSGFHGNELLHIEDETGYRFWGITKRAIRHEITGSCTLELFIYAENSDHLPIKGRWLCMMNMDTNSHLREYIAVETVPSCPILNDILASKYVKKSSKKKNKSDLDKIVDYTDLILDEKLNPSQRNAVNTVVNRTSGISLIQGPPGTGKTRTIVSVINVLLQQSKESILVCTPSNTAVDEITCHLSKMKCVVKPRIVRVSAYGRGLSCKEVLLQHIAEASKDSKSNLNLLNVQAVETGAEDAAAQGWHSYEVDELLNRRDALENMCRQTEWSSRKDILREADIVLCTLSMAASPAMQSALAIFKTVIIDEAAQSVEPSVLIPLGYGCQRCILIGDPCQLPATVLSTEALAHGYGKSLFERLKEAGMPVHLLDTQYRMHPVIRSFPARYFYEDRLKDAVPTMDKSQHQRWYFGPFLLFNITWGTETVRGTSIYNDAEALFATLLLQQVLREFPNSSLGSTAILTTYRAQVERIQQESKTISLNQVDIGTVDGFQGREADTVILSCVRTHNDEYGFIEGGVGSRIGFLSDRRRMNVALTRARHSLWVIGNVDTLKTNPDWGEFVEDADRRGLLVDVTIDNKGCRLHRSSTGETYHFEP